MKKQAVILPSVAGIDVSNLADMQTVSYVQNYISSCKSYYIVCLEVQWWVSLGHLDRCDGTVSCAKHARMEKLKNTLHPNHPEWRCYMLERFDIMLEKHFLYWESTLPNFWMTSCAINSVWFDVLKHSWLIPSWHSPAVNYINYLLSWPVAYSEPFFCTHDQHESFQ